MTPGSVWFDAEFHFHDGETGEKLFVALGNAGLTYLVAKTTSQQHGRGTDFGCQPSDRFPNFFLPPGSCYLKKPTWICLDEFYEFDARSVMRKQLSGQVKPVCTLPNEIARLVQDCAMLSLDITPAQHAIINACLIA